MKRSSCKWAGGAAVPGSPCPGEWPSLLGQFELGHQGAEIVRKAGELGCRYRGILGALRRALHDFRDPVDVAGDLADGRGLLLGGGGDLVDLKADRVDLVQDLLQRAPRFGGLL